MLVDENPAQFRLFIIFRSNKLSLTYLDGCKLFKNSQISEIPGTEEVWPVFWEFLENKYEGRSLNSNSLDTLCVNKEYTLTEMICG